jgi:hypothetical protein
MYIYTYIMLIQYIMRNIIFFIYIYRLYARRSAISSAPPAVFRFFFARTYPKHRAKKGCLTKPLSIEERERERERERV